MRWRDWIDSRHTFLGSGMIRSSEMSIRDELVFFLSWSIWDRKNAWNEQFATLRLLEKKCEGRGDYGIELRAEEEKASLQRRSRTR